ncbi:MAG: hypothetical protein A2252_08705 [Elusimicrobia bacterium RIFOXYA2_FULL_39_19]|nr:MAG: hypothetical protein A2252_08705 [Elusimicrobia bacterium RIFOXYA2_FULL_39_19]
MKKYSESTIVELKPSLSQIKEIIETISAFANTEGGKIYIGIADTGQIQGLPEPVYEEAGGSFVTVFKSPEKINNVQNSSEKSSEKIFRIISARPAISAQELAEILGITSRAVEKQLAKLKNKGIIKRIGPDKGGRWDVNN